MVHLNMTFILCSWGGLRDSPQWGEDSLAQFTSAAVPGRLDVAAFPGRTLSSQGGCPATEQPRSCARASSVSLLLHAVLPFNAPEVSSDSPKGAGGGSWSQLRWHPGGVGTEASGGA